MHAEGSVLIEVGRTQVICTASVEDRVPPFLRGTGKGWVTAEYGMLPRATSTRTHARSVGGQSRRPHAGDSAADWPIAAIGRALTELGERTVWIDCDVIQADGGTRTASITGGFVALVLALERLREQGAIARDAGHRLRRRHQRRHRRRHADARSRLRRRLARRRGHERRQDRRRPFIEIQGTAEAQPFDRAAFDSLLALAEQGIRSSSTNSAR